MKLLGFVHTKKFGVVAAKTSHDEASNGGSIWYARIISYYHCYISKLHYPTNHFAHSMYNHKCAPTAGTLYLDAFWYGSHSERFTWNVVFGKKDTQGITLHL